MVSVNRSVLHWMILSIRLSREWMDEVLKVWVFMPLSTFPLWKKTGNCLMKWKLNWKVPSLSTLPHWAKPPKWTWKQIGILQVLMAIICLRNGRLQRKISQHSGRCWILIGIIPRYLSIIRMPALKIFKTLILVSIWKCR